jgi:5-oxoprolinase (ATP-hydrolysing)/N-methylhydantoinase A
MGAGQGASQRSDGKSALLYPTSAANTSVELMEARAPVLVLEKSFVIDSGGAGDHRGGCGVRGVVLDPQGNVTHDCGTGELVTLTRTDQIVEVQLAGGAGFGDPRARSAGLVEQDVAEGVVSPESALHDYGWQQAAGKAAE